MIWANRPNTHNTHTQFFLKRKRERLEGMEGLGRRGRIERMRVREKQTERERKIDTEKERWRPRRGKGDSKGGLVVGAALVWVARGAVWWWSVGRDREEADEKQRD